MGSNLLTCQRNTNHNAEIIVKQLEIYKWRQINPNKYLPKVILASQSELKHQQVLRQFLDRQRNQDTISVQKINQKIQQITQNNQQMLNFERYACYLKEIDSVLQIQELAYLLIALLTAYEEIKKKYPTIIVQRQCCFVTFQGEVRAWINSNSKSNSLQSPPNYQYFSQRDYRQIVTKVITISKQTAIKNQLNLNMISQLQRYFSSSLLRNDIFELHRYWITQYCKNQGVLIANNIKSGLARVKTFNILKFSKRKSLNKESPSFKEDGTCNNSLSYFNIPRSNSVKEQINRSQIQQRFLKYNHKNSDTTFASYLAMNQSSIVIPPIYTAHQQKVPIKVTFSQNSHTNRTYEENQKNRGKYIMNTNEKLLIQEENKDKETQKASFQINQNKDCNFFEISQQQTGTLIEGKFLTSKEITNNLTSRNSRLIRYRKANDQRKNVMRKVSILDLEKSQSEPSQLKQNKKPELCCHTFQQIISIPSFPDADRPWITSKTITRLIPQGFDKVDSLVHSVGTSSQNNGSEYGGALSNMGRDISTHKRSNTMYLAKGN